MLTSETRDLRIAERLDHETLAGLANGELEVIWDRRFYARELCEQALPRITEACSAAAYTLTADLQSLGTSVGEAAESGENRDRYYASAPETTRLIRDDLFAGIPSPLDRLRVTLDECWSGGALVARAENGSHMLPGIIRRWPSGGHANPHIDQRENGVLDHLRLTRRIAMNIYLEIPSAGRGGEIEFWRRMAEDEYVAMRRSDYGLDRDMLGPPTYSLLPGQGDLVMFDASIIHGVAAVETGSRVTAACFAGCIAPDWPLELFA